MNVGFYYLANACGRLGGTILSGLLYHYFALAGCLWACVTFTLAAGILSRFLPTAGQGQVALSALGGDE